MILKKIKTQKEKIDSITNQNQRRKVMTVQIFSAAEGNPTALVIDQGLERKDYPRINQQIQQDNPEVEQVGFYEEENGVPRLQMAGGEFCGNAARSFSCLLKEFFPDQSFFRFYASGYEGQITGQIEERGDQDYFCEVELEDMPYRIEEKNWNGTIFSVVDMGGITHIIVSEKDYSFRENNYSEQVKEVREQLGVDNSAVGVLWVSESGGEIYMKPVVWVKDIDTCYYETSCGSGSMAVAFQKGKNSTVIQPSGGDIRVEWREEKLVLSSRMKKIKEVDYVRT